MSKLIQSFNEQMASGKDGYRHKESTNDVSYSSGFANLDYLNGQLVHVITETDDFYYPMLGFPDGKGIGCIGNSGVGKTTLLIQMAAEIIRPFKNGAIWHMDLESGTNGHRIEKLTKMTQDEITESYHYQNTNITSEVFYEQIKWIRDQKINNQGDYTYSTGLLDFRGNQIVKYVPTCYIIDSLPELMPDDIMEDDKLGGQMDTTSSVKKNSFIFRKINQLCKEANIIVMCINHILEDVNINPYARKKASIAGGVLKQGERLPGGKSMQYLTNTLLRLDAASVLKPDEGFGVDGMAINVSTGKSRTNRSNQIVPMIFDKYNGFSNELSIYALLDTMKRVKGSGSYQYFESLPDLKFSRKNLLEMLNKHPELKVAMAKEALPVLQAYIDDSKDLGYEEDNTVNINNLIMEMAKGNAPLLESHSVPSEEVVPKKMRKSKEEVLDIVSDMKEGDD